MAKYDSMEDIGDKADWEGGWAEFILSYGLRPEDLPDDAPPGLTDAVNAFRTAWDELERLIEPWI